MTALPKDTAAAAAAATHAPIATPTVFRVPPSLENLPSLSSAASPASSSSSSRSSAESPVSSISLPSRSIASSLSESSRSIPFRAACALFNWICQAWVRRSFSPKDSAALARACFSISTFLRWASTCSVSTLCRAVRASAESSFLENWDSTNFISEPRTLKDWLISVRAFLNSFSPSRPIFRPKLSAIDEHLPFRFRDTVVLLMALPKVEE